MQNQSDKTLDKRREEARRALEGEERQKQRKEREDRKKEIKEKKIKEDKKQREEKEKLLREKKEREKEDVKRKEEETKRKKEEEVMKKKEEGEKKEIEEEKRKAQKEALLKKILPKGKTLKTSSPEKMKEVNHVSLKNTKKYKVSLVRTYQTDIAKTVKNRKESVVKIALAERKRRKEKIKKERKGKTTQIKNKRKRVILILIIAVTLIALGSLSVFYINNKNIFKNILPNLSNVFKPTEKKTQTIKPIKFAPALISPNSEKKITFSKNNSEILQIISKEIRKSLGVGDIENIYLSEITTITVSGKTEEQEKISSVDKLFSIWSPNISAELSRSLGNKFMIGIYSLTADKNFPFLILTTNSYEQTFAGMFAWEKYLLNDFYDLFGINKPLNLMQKFRDKEIGGVDTRALVDTSGETKLIYSFVGKNILIITKNENALKEILSRIKR